jgi:hypothetical protein
MKGNPDPVQNEYRYNACVLVRKFEHGFLGFVPWSTNNSPPSTARPDIAVLILP